MNQIIRRKSNALKAAWNQLIYELKIPARRRVSYMGAEAETWRTNTAKRKEAYRLQNLWRAWMGTRPYTIGTAPYGTRSHPSNDQLKARIKYWNKFITAFTVVYNGIFRDWGLTFESLSKTEQSYYVDEIGYRIDKEAGEEPGESGANLPGVERGHDTPIGPIDEAGYKKYGTPAKTENDFEKYLKFLPAVGVGFTAFRLFLSK